MKLIAVALAFVNVTVVPMDSERVIPAQTVVVEDGRITRIGPAHEIALDEGVTMVDGSGRYLIPGLAEMHAHIPGDPQVAENTLFLYLANGITTARGMLGAPAHLELRARAARGGIASPRIVTSGPSLNGNSVPNAKVARAMVAAQAEAGYDFLKLHPGLDLARFEAIDAAADEHGIPYAGHVSTGVGLARALAAGQATVDHLDGYLPPLLRDGSPLAGRAPQFFGWNLAAEVDESKIVPLAARTREAGTWVVPTESLMQHVLLPEPTAAELAARPEMHYMPAATVSNWIEAKRGFVEDGDYDPALVHRFIEVRAALLRALAAEDVLLLGSDAPQIFNVPGFSIHHELAMLVEAGLSPYQALRSGTVNVARFFGESDRAGTVAIGKRADLVLLERNPLVDVGAVRERAGVMVAGRWYPASELDAGLARIAAARRAP